jgi:membrane protease YdiL (CAAX protease family)
LTWAFPGLRTAEVNPLLEMIRTREDVFFFVTMSVLGGGLGEETVRAFVLQRFERYLGGIALGLLLWSIAFGMMHQIQGLDKAITVGLLGLLLGLIYIWRRDPLAAITAHAGFNVVQTLLAYFAGRNPG